MSNRTEIYLEFIFACSTPMLHKFLTTSEGLKSWFCDDVVIKNELYTFSWEGETEKALLKEDPTKPNILFEWQGREAPESTFFEIISSAITRETILKVMTVCDESSQDEEVIYWNNIIKILKTATGG